MRAQTDKHELAALWKKVEAIGRIPPRHPIALGVKDKTASSSSGSKGCAEEGRKPLIAAVAVGGRRWLVILWLS